MKNKYKLTKSLLRTAKQFYENEQGVYVVMTALLAFPLLFLIAFTVDGTGALLDRARLAQATDQATLLLITEDNKNRSREKDRLDKHNDLITQDVSAEKAEAEKNGSPFNTLDAQVEKRNQQLVQGLVKLYLRSDDSLSNKNSSPITIPNDFLAECKEVDTDYGQNGRKKEVACTVQGTVQRKFILPWSHELVTPGQLKDGRLAVNSGQAYAVKEKQFAIPLEIMLVSDFSGSMKDDINGKKTNIDSERKITELRQSVREIADLLLPKNPEKSEINVSPFNRIGFTTFAEGARERDETRKCVLPYKLKTTPLKLRVWAGDESRLNTRLNFSNCGRKKLAAGNVVNACETLSPVQPDTILKRALAQKIPQWGTQISLWSTIELMFDKAIDVTATIKQIEEFKPGKKTDYPYKFEDGMYCLGGNVDKKTTQAWFSQDNNKVADALDKINPQGGTAASSGMIIGTELFMDTNQKKEASPETLGVNTRRIMIVLSDGIDNAPTPNTLLSLLNADLCNAIRNKVNTLQDTRYPLQNTEIHFIAFGYTPSKEQADAWEQCVIDKKKNYHEARKRGDLLNTFKQIVSIEEEVGRSSSQKPKLFQ
ncbi:pilus assembly protein TadG-related protein [Aggregatibacter kilianii]|uniref:pilus assembly protein TadG-related protein n=1 Tax=Aggregatibacter kilianii TaxID=2025884 RepID=UPI000D65C02E|nr:pilus assembly protein TadG-related protein [Aggregatibacter kilianii]